jgi:CHAD domain/CYTH domain
MATVVREIEGKYELAAGGTAALDAVKTMTGTAGIAAVSQQDEQLLDAVYHDTADLRLIGAGITLRRRTGGGDPGWRLKLPAGADTRDEIRPPLAAPGGKRTVTPRARVGGAVPEELAALVRACTRGTALAPVVRIQTRRRVLRLLDGAGQILAEIAADYATTVPADGSAATSWDEIEAELAAVPPVLVVGPVQARITGHFSAELAQAGQTALAALDGQRYLRLLDDLDALLAGPPLTPPAKREAGKVLAKPVRRAGRRLQRALAAVPGAEDRDAAIHEARKATKRAWYAAEAAVPALGRTASRQAAQAKELQQLLGDHHDSVVARTVLLDLAQNARAAGEDTFTYGLMHQRQACQAASIEQALPRFTAAQRDRTTGY